MLSVREGVKCSKEMKINVFKFSRCSSLLLSGCSVCRILRLNMDITCVCVCVCICLTVMLTFILAYVQQDMTWREVKSSDSQRRRLPCVLHVHVHILYYPQEEAWHMHSTNPRVAYFCIGKLQQSCDRAFIVDLQEGVWTGSYHLFTVLSAPSALLLRSYHIHLLVLICSPTYSDAERCIQCIQSHVWWASLTMLFHEVRNDRCRKALILTTREVSKSNLSYHLYGSSRASTSLLGISPRSFLSLQRMALAFAKPESVRSILLSKLNTAHHVRN